MNYFPTAPLAESSKAKFNRAIRRWLDIIGNRATLMTIVNNPRVAMNYLENTEAIKNTPENHHGFISAIVAYVQHELMTHKNHKGMMMTWKQLQAQNQKPINARHHTGEPTERQKAKVVDWETVCKVRDELPLSSTKILLAMYSYVPPQRGGDFYDCKVFEKDPKTTEGNYLVLEPGKECLVMNDYKTEKVYGQNRIPLVEPLVKLLREYWSKYKNPYDALFVKSEKEEPYTRSMFSAWAIRRLTEAFGKPMTLTVIRHAFITSQDFNGPVKELKATASAMGHSMGLQQAYRWEK